MSTLASWWFNEIFGDDLSDYEYVSRQNANSNIVVTTGTITEGTTDQVERTVPNGKTAYILKAKVIPDTLLATASKGNQDYEGIFDLEVDSTIVDKTHIGSKWQTGGVGNEDNANTNDGELGNGAFDTEGADRLVGDGAKKLGVHVSSASSAKTFFVRIVTLEVSADSDLKL